MRKKQIPRGKTADPDDGRSTEEMMTEYAAIVGPYLSETDKDRLHELIHSDSKAIAILAVEKELLNEFYDADFCDGLALSLRDAREGRENPAADRFRKAMRATRIRKPAPPKGKANVADEAA